MREIIHKLKILKLVLLDCYETEFVVGVVMPQTSWRIPEDHKVNGNWVFFKHIYIFIVLLFDVK